MRLPPLSFFIPHFGVAVGVPRAYCRCGLDYLSSHLLMKFEITPAAIDKTKFIKEHIQPDPLSVASIGSDNVVIVSYSDKIFKYN
jgi:hypothetical protein